MAACLSGHDFEYKVRKRNPLQFDCNYWEELNNRYARFRIKYIGMIVGSFIVMLLGGAIFYVAAILDRTAESTAIPAFLPFFALELGVLIDSISMMDAYEVLAYHEEHVNRFTRRQLNKISSLLDRLF